MRSGGPPAAIARCCLLIAPRPSLYPVQTTLFPMEGVPPDLYLRQRSGAPVVRRAAPDGAECVALARGDTLSTDTFFGAFHRAYWLAHTNLHDLAIEIRLVGAGRLRVLEIAGGVPRCLTETALEAPLARTLRIALPGWAGQGTPSGRLVVELEATAPVRLFALDFVTPQPPLRRTTLSIGLCTFNQERRFTRTLARLLRLAEGCKAIGALHVVNQGAPFASDELRALVARPPVRLVQQRNLGGCGGFTRGLYAALHDPAAASHHLMMDDDIVLDERMIPRALRFLDRANRDIALGAGMLDSLRPGVMYEAGAFLRRGNTIAAHCQDVDMTGPDALAHFDTPVATDYNAWWFCILPLAPCRAVGLPAPVFIRGDDFEYGQRLARAGVPTVTLPGIGVWHEPFYAKADGWQSYYDLRNRLIFAATYPERVRQLGVAHLGGLIASAILTHAHAMAELRLRAVEDFLAGPDALFARDAEALHGGIMAINRAAAPAPASDPAWRAAMPIPGRPRAEGLAWLAAQYVGSLLRTGLGPLRRRPDRLLMDRDAHPGNTAGRAYVMTNRQRSFHLLFVPQRRRMWRLVVRTAAVMWRFRRRRDAAQRDWHEGIAPYRTPEWWRGTFGLPAPVPVPGRANGAATAAPETADPGGQVAGEADAASYGPDAARPRAGAGLPRATGSAGSGR